MSDAIKATIQIMQTPEENIKIRSSYNLSGISFNPEEIANEIKKHIPVFTISYKEDFRQKIADSWPQTINDKDAQKDWGWSPEYNLATMSDNMIKNLKNIVT